MSIYSGATVGWLALSAVLAGVVAFELSENTPLAPTVTAAPIEPVSSGPDDLALTSIVAPGLELLDAIIERPLFSVTRRPDEPVVDDQVVAVDVPTEELSLELVGTMLSGDSQVVLLKHPDKGLLRLREGQTVEGWEIGRIGHNLVELRNGDEVERLKLRAELLSPKKPGKKHLQSPRKNDEGQKKPILKPGDAAGETMPLAKQ